MASVAGTLDLLENVGHDLVQTGLVLGRDLIDGGNRYLGLRESVERVADRLCPLELGVDLGLTQVRIQIVFVHTSQYTGQAVVSAWDSEPIVLSGPFETMSEAGQYSPPNKG